LRSALLIALSLLSVNLFFILRSGTAPPEVHRCTRPHVSGSVESAPRTAPPPEALTDGAFLAPIQIEGLTLIPIVETAASEPAQDVLVLDEAMRTKLVTIREVDGGRVDQLELTNRSDQPLFVLAGEIILGGKQDRVIAANTVIPAKTTQAVAVFCVERGRWDNSSTEFTTAEALAHNRLRGNASYDAQGDVWDEVNVSNSRQRTTSSTDTYRTIAVQQRDGAYRSLEDRVYAALGGIPVADRARMIGYAIALDGNVTAIDLFRSSRLFAKLERKLVRSYLAEVVGWTPVAAAKAPSIQAIKDFMANADRAAVERSYETTLSATRIKRGTLADNANVQLKTSRGDRHLYSNYLGNNPGASRRDRRPDVSSDRHLYPSYLGNADRHLYPGYLGNAPGNQPQPTTGGTPARLRRTNE
jgi:hypothetical protein